MRQSRNFRRCGWPILACVDSDVHLQLIKIVNNTEPHYAFTPRQLGRMFQGILAPSKEIVRTWIGGQQTPTNLSAPLVIVVRLWLHECERVFRDKRASQADEGSYQELVARKGAFSAPTAEGMLLWHYEKCTR